MQEGTLPTLSVHNVTHLQKFPIPCRNVICRCKSESPLEQVIYKLSRGIIREDEVNFILIGTEAPYEIAG